MTIPETTLNTNAANAKDSKVIENKIERPLAEMKHPLQNAWTLWYCRNDRSRNWEDNLKEVIIVYVVFLTLGLKQE